MPQPVTYTKHDKHNAVWKKIHKAYPVLLRIRETSVGKVILGTYKLPGSLDPLVLPLCLFEVVELVTRMKD